MPRPTIAVIDGDSLMHRAFHAVPPTMNAPDGRPTNAVFGFISMFLKMMDDLAPDAVFCAFDKGQPAFRKEALSQYKAQRKPTDEALKVQFPIIKELLRSMSVPVIELQDWEGDDILGTLARLGVEAERDVLLVTGDRDAYQLVNDHVRVVTTRKGISDIAVMGPDEVLDRYGVRVDQVTDYLGLKGDTSDNIPGIPGVGEKTAAKLLQEHDTLEAVLEAAPDIKGKLGERLREHGELARASRVVATIADDVPIEVDFDEVMFPAFDPAAVRRAFGEVRFRAHLDKVLLLQDGACEVDDAGDCADPEDGFAIRAAVTGDDAEALLGAAIESAAWVGIGVDDGEVDSLFGEGKRLFVATPNGLARFDDAESDGVVSATVAELLRSGRIVSLDVKALSQLAVPADSSVPALIEPQAMDPARLFDLGIAAYLLDSTRSTYDSFSLADAYLGVALPEPGEDTPAGALAAEAALALHPPLSKSLEADGSMHVFAEIDMPLVPVLVEMERVGVALDPGVLAELSAYSLEQIEGLRAEIYAFAGEEFTIDSPKQLSVILFEKLNLPPGRKTKTGYSTDASVLADLAPLHPIADKIVAYREMAKLRSTYLEALPRMLAADDRLHTTYGQTVAATGRLASSNPNLQNIPVRTEFGRRIREAFVAGEPDWVMITADYSQIELRLLAHLSEDPGLIAAFAAGADFHTATAAAVFGVDIDEVTTDLRARAKAVNFGIVYGQQAFGLSTSLGISWAEAQEMIDRYFAAYPKVRQYLDDAVAEARRDGFSTTMYGRKRRIPEFLSGNPNTRAFGDRTAMNHPMQGSAADIIKLAMIDLERRLHQEGFAGRMVLQVHDELVFEAPVDEVERLGAVAVEAMVNAAELHVPLEVHISSAGNWAEAK